MTQDTSQKENKEEALSVELKPIERINGAGVTTGVCVAMKVPCQEARVTLVFLESTRRLSFFPRRRYAYTLRKIVMNLMRNDGKGCSSLSSRAEAFEKLGIYAIEGMLAEGETFKHQVFTPMLDFDAEGKAVLVASKSPSLLGKFSSSFQKIQPSAPQIVCPSSFCALARLGR